MVKQKLYNMKQPELGKRISELRKAKGFTQEELVEKCNLNVRTIQRIEAGEVTPRSYTIKALFEALGQAWEKPLEEKPVAEQKVSPLMYLAVGSAILYFFISMLEIGIEQEFLEGDTSFGNWAFAFVKTGSYLFYIGFLAGWLVLIKSFPNGILKMALWIMISANVIWYSIDLISIFSGAITLEDYFFFKVSSFGFLYAFLGIGFIAYKQKFSSIGLITGVLLVIAGVFMFTGVGAIIALIPWTLGEILQIGLMIYLLQKHGGRNSPVFS